MVENVWVAVDKLSLKYFASGRCYEIKKYQFANKYLISNFLSCYNNNSICKLSSSNHLPMIHKCGKLYLIPKKKK